MTERTTTRFGGARRMAAQVLLPVLASSAAMAGAVAFGGAANAAITTQTLTYVATDDAYTSTARPTLNTGSVTKMVAGKLSNDSMVTYLKFKVGTLPAGSTVKSVELNVHKYDRLPTTAQLFKVGGTGWTEKTLTNANRPALGSLISSVSPVDTDTKASFNATGAVTTAGTYAFAVNSPVAEDVARFRAKEYGVNPPLLKITVSTTVVSSPTPTTPAPTTPTPAPTTPTPAPTTPVPTTPPPTTPVPTTPPPTTPVPTTPVPTTPPPTTPPVCTVSVKLVPSCNILWGAAAGGFSETPRDQALREWEEKSGRVASVYHTYHRGDEQFPTKSEIAMANEAGKPRVLFTNWKVAYGTTWAKVAAGGQNARIDKLAAYIKANYNQPFFMAIHHEPENDVNATAGSGMTAKDFAAMFRHTALRMRAQGATNVVFVVAYMGIEKFYNQPWWYDLYPGDEAVDWIGLDAYVASEPGGYHYGTLTDLVNRTTDKTKFPGFYNWHQASHANKPLMLSEWGVHEYAADPTQKAKILSTVLTELTKFPAIKGMLWFDTAKDQNGSDIRIDSSSLALTEFRKIAADPRFLVQVR